MMLGLERYISGKNHDASCWTENSPGPYERRNRLVWLGEAGEARDDRPPLDLLTLACRCYGRPGCLRTRLVALRAIARDPVTGIARVNEDNRVGEYECRAQRQCGAIGCHAWGQDAAKCDQCVDRGAEAEPTTTCSSVFPGKAIYSSARDALLAIRSTGARPWTWTSPCWARR